MAQRITIVVDDEGDCEIRSTKDLTDEDVLDILALALDATSEKLEMQSQQKDNDEEAITETLKLYPQKSKYLN